MHRVVPIVLISLVGLAACKSKQKSQQSESQSSVAASASNTGTQAEAKTKPASSAAAKPPSPHAGDTTLQIEWQDPPGWKRVKPKSPMRKASYQVPPADGDTEPAQLSVFYFGSGQGGTVEANMQRWAGQFKDVTEKDIKHSERTANGLTQHIIQIPKGSFSGGMFGGGKLKENQGLLGAVVESPSGMYFFKMTGPSKTVSSAEEAFFKMLDGMKSKQ